MKIFIIIALLWFFSADVEAYLDPGTGSMLLQVILGGVAAVGVALKLYWHRIKAALGRRKTEQAEDDSV